MGQLRSYLLDGYPQPAAHHLAFLLQLFDDLLGQVDGDGESDALAGGDNRGIYAHHLTLQIEQRAAAVSRIYRGVGLNKVIVRTRPDCPALSTDYAGGDGM